MWAVKDSFIYIGFDFINGGYSIDSPTSLFWKQLATAVVFGLGIATMLTLLVTPSFLALRVWVSTYARWLALLVRRTLGGRAGQVAQDMALNRAMRDLATTEIIWEDVPAPGDTPAARPDLAAAE